MKYLTRTSVAFFVAAITPMLVIGLELAPEEPLVPALVSYAILALSGIALTYALIETFVGVEEADENELEEMADLGM